MRVENVAHPSDGRRVGRDLRRRSENPPIAYLTAATPRKVRKPYRTSLSNAEIPNSTPTPLPVDAGF